MAARSASEMLKRDHSPAESGTYGYIAARYALYISWNHRMPYLMLSSDLSRLARRSRAHLTGAGCAADLAAGAQNWEGEAEGPH